MRGVVMQFCCEALWQVGKNMLSNFDVYSIFVAKQLSSYSSKQYPANRTSCVLIEVPEERSPLFHTAWFMQDKMDGRAIGPYALCYYLTSELLLMCGGAAPLYCKPML